MDLRPIIKEIGRGAHGARELPEDVAKRLFGVLL
ncbi:MAG: DNA-binding protein YbiB, partial [Betaproteobacteria bacterium]|nr:DNA-binding protein YbiB [Betaproteobacteria bacterium]